jgi:hypothetical protein
MVMVTVMRITERPERADAAAAAADDDDIRRETPSWRQ